MYKVKCYDHTTEPYPPIVTQWNVETLNEAKQKVKELIKEHSYGCGEPSVWFNFSIEESYEKIITKTCWKQLYAGKKEEDFQ